MPRFNSKSPAVKRIMKEAMELSDPTYEYHAAPLDDNIYEWHFTYRGPDNSEFEGGFYHGKIILPNEYPMKPPNIIILNPSGRFETHKKICLSISGYHPETWQPSWSIRTAMLALIAFMETKSEGSVGGLDYTKEERIKLAKKSQTFKCDHCGLIKNLLLQERPENCSANDEKDRKLAKQITLTKPTGDKDKQEEKAGGKTEEEKSREQEKTGEEAAKEENKVATEEAGSSKDARQEPTSSTAGEVKKEQKKLKRRRTQQQVKVEENPMVEFTSQILVVVLVSVILFLVYRRVHLMLYEA